MQHKLAVLHRETVLPDDDVHPLRAVFLPGQFLAQHAAGEGGLARPAVAEQHHFGFEQGLDARFFFLAEVFEDGGVALLYDFDRRVGEGVVFYANLVSPERIPDHRNILFNHMKRWRDIFNLVFGYIKRG